MRRQRTFISYRRSDTAGHAGRLEVDLTRRLRSPVFMDVHDIRAGEDFVQALDRELGSCSAVLALIGPRWLEGFSAEHPETDYVRLELRQALARAGVVVIPVLVQSAALPPAAELPEDVRALAHREAIALRDDRWDDDVANLARALGAPRLPRWLLPATLAVLALAATAAWLLTPVKPGPYDHPAAHAHAVAVTKRAVGRCTSKGIVAGECPVQFNFPPSGKAEDVFYPVGDCDFKGTPFGECLLEKLAGTSIPPYDDLEKVEIEVTVRMSANGSYEVIDDE